MLKRKGYFIFLITLLSFSCGSDNVDTTDHGPTIPKDFLSGEIYNKLVIEIQYIPGFQPSDETVNNLTNFLQSRLNKPQGISFVRTPVPAPNVPSFSVADAQAMEVVKRSQKNAGKTLTAYLLFANGDFAGNSGNSKVLGVAYSTSSIMIFEKTIRDFSGDFGQPARTTLETVVLEHEFGHLFGLVDNGSPMKTPHLDSAHSNHCNDTNCIMFYNVETSDVLSNFLGGNIPTLTTPCVIDLKSNGGK